MEKTLFSRVAYVDIDAYYIMNESLFIYLYGRNTTFKGKHSIAFWQGLEK